MMDLDVSKINGALTACQGDRQMAAQILGIPPEELQRRIATDPGLKVRWTKQNAVNGGPVPPPSEADVLKATARLQSEMIAEAPDRDELAAAQSIQEEDRLLRQSLDSIGLTQKEKDIAIALQQFAQKFFKTTLDLTCAGLGRQTIKLIVEIDNVMDRLADVRKEISKATRDGEMQVIHGGTMYDPRARWVDEEKMLMNTHATYLKILESIMTCQFNAAKTVAVIKSFAANRTAQKKKKPSFDAVTETTIDAEEVVMPSV